jgi:hypothetical protein
MGYSLGHLDAFWSGFTQASPAHRHSIYYEHSDMWRFVSIRTQALKREVRCLKEEGNIGWDLTSQKVADILKRTKASIRQARLLQRSPDGDTFMQMTWEQFEAGARANRPGRKVVCES